MIGNFLIVVSVILPLVSGVFAEDYRPLRSEDGLLYNVRYAYVEFQGDSRKRLECQRLRKAGKAGAECRVFRVDFKWIIAVSALMIVGGFYLRRRCRFRFEYQRPPFGIFRNEKGPPAGSGRPFVSFARFARARLRRLGG